MSAEKKEVAAKQKAKRRMKRVKNKVDFRAHLYKGS